MDVPVKKNITANPLSVVISLLAVYLDVKILTHGTA
jgi:hypothetical protein